MRPMDIQTDGGTPTHEAIGFNKLLVFILFTQVAQALMSYDGGATQMSTQALLEAGWSSSMLGLLGAMDKFGQVATAFAWSYFLRKHNTKLLLGFGLFSKAASCMCFGLFTNKALMLISKLGMGVFEALIGVWSTVWVQGHAPEDAKARWLGLAGISAGLGNGVGSAVAGLCARRFGYAFAFVVQACVLFLLWLIMLCSPGEWFDFKTANDAATKEESRAEMIQHRVRRSMSGRCESTLMHAVSSRSNDDAASTTSDQEPLTEDGGTAADVWNSLTTVASSGLWLWTAMAVSLSCFLTSAVAYMWQTVVCNAWMLSSEEATISFLIVTGGGGAVGVTLGPKLFDGHLRGFARPEGKVACMTWCARLNAIASFLSTICAGLFAGVAWHALHHEAAKRASFHMMALVLISIFFIFALVNAVQGTLYGINTDSVQMSLQTTAVGMTVSLQNIVGFAFGPLVPSMTADFAGSMYSAAWPGLESAQAMRSAQFSTGMAVALMSSWLLFISAHRGEKSARRIVRIRDVHGGDDVGPEALWPSDRSPDNDE